MWQELNSVAKNTGKYAGLYVAVMAQLTAELSNAEDAAISDERAVGMKSRRSSMAVLYNRIVRSQEAPVEVKYVAGVAFALQAGQFVACAAMIRKGGLFA
jgi:hypothetical protein